LKATALENLSSAPWLVRHYEDIACLLTPTACIIETVQPDSEMIW
jgi:hypothetical protein